MRNKEYELLKEKLSDVSWRLNNLYYIQDENGKEVKFKLRPEQQDFLDNAHGLDIVLKARQLGFSTLIDIMGLDHCFFNKGQSFGIIADTLDNAKKLLRNKIKFAYNRLPEQLRDANKLIKNDTLEIQFENGSTISVGTSHRSGTLQILHISEYGKICAKSPEKAREIKAGALNTIQAGQRIIIESTAEGDDGDFYQMTTRALSKKDSELSLLDFKCHFYGWYGADKYRLACPDDYVFTPEMISYFNELRSHNINLDRDQKYWYVKKKEMLMNDQGTDLIKQEYPSTPKEAFEQSIEGRYYYEQITKAINDNRVCEFPIEKGVAVDAYFDLGRSDFTSIIFVQTIGREERIIDFMEANDEHISFFAHEMKNKGYIYGKIYLPHDAKNELLSAKKNIYDQMVEFGFDCEIVDKLSIELGINESRKKIGEVWFKKSTTEILIKRLKNYKKKWSEQMQRYTGALHDENSHAADAFRYYSVTKPKQTYQSSRSFNIPTASAWN